jgi:hypothetical protein
MECHNPKKCLKEISPGFFIGKAFVYEEEWLSCYFCKTRLEEKNEEKGEDDEFSE